MARHSHTRHHARKTHAHVRAKAHAVRLAHHHYSAAQAAQAAGISTGGSSGRTRVTRSGGEEVVQ